VHRDHFALQAGVTGLGAFIDKPYVEILDKRMNIPEILVENQLAANETMFIGDMQHDIETAKHGGVLLIGICVFDAARFRENCFSIKFMAGDFLPVFAEWQVLFCRFLGVKAGAGGSVTCKPPLLRSSRGHEAQTSSSPPATPDAKGIDQSLLTSAATNEMTRPDWIAETRFHAIERLPPEGRGRATQFIPAASRINIDSAEKA